MEGGGKSSGEPGGGVGASEQTQLRGTARTQRPDRGVARSRSGRTERRGQRGAWRSVEGPLQQQRPARRRRGRTVRQGRPGGRWRDHCSNKVFTLPLGSFCLHRKNYSPHPPFCSFQLLSTPTRKKIRLPPSPFVARLPPLPKVPRLLSVALHLPSSPEVPRLLFVALRLSIGSNRETEGDGEEADGERRRRRATKGGGDSPNTKGSVATACRCR